MKKRVLGVLLATTMIMGLVGCGAKDSAGSGDGSKGGETLTLKLAENQSKGNPITEGMQKLADLVRKKQMVLL